MKCPEKWRSSSWFLLHDNGSTSVGFGQEFLVKEIVTTLQHPLNSSDC
jgi:hypothetical protein